MNLSPIYARNVLNKLQGSPPELFFTAFLVVMVPFLAVLGLALGPLLKKAVTFIVICFVLREITP